MATTQTKIKTAEMQKFITTQGGNPEDLMDRFNDLSTPTEMFEYIAELWISGGFDKAAKKAAAKATKDPNKPKGALSAYMFMCKDRRPGVVRANPTW